MTNTVAVIGPYRLKINKWGALSTLENIAGMEARSSEEKRFREI